MNKIIFKVLAALIAAVILAACLCAGINIYVINTAKKVMYLPQEYENSGADCIIVLGAGLRPDGSPSHMLRDRLDEAVRLYKSGAAEKILMSGDHGRKEYDEVNTMKNYAVSKGVPEENIFLDHAGFSTYDTMYRAKAIFCIEKPVIVTQKYHMYRAVYIANSFGLEASGVSSDPYRYVGQSMRDIREVAARVKDFFYCVFKPEPVFLGEAIDIKTSAAAETNG